MMHTIPTMRILTDKLQLVMFSICGWDCEWNLCQIYLLLWVKATVMYPMMHSMPSMKILTGKFQHIGHWYFLALSVLSVKVTFHFVQVILCQGVSWAMVLFLTPCGLCPCETSVCPSKFIQMCWLWLTRLALVLFGTPCALCPSDSSVRPSIFMQSSWSWSHILGTCTFLNSLWSQTKWLLSLSK